MKQVVGTSYNIEEELVGRITFGKKGLFCRSNDILVYSGGCDKPAFGYLAVVADRTPLHINEKPYCVVDNIDDFNEGDVVVINKRGEIVFVYEINSRHNALMATERCNHRCIMCPQPPVLQENDKTPFNLKLISLFDKATQEIGITGGEPTLIGDNLFTLINHIKKELPRTAISILSNGVKFADKEYAMKLSMCRHQDLQIDIPLFSDIAEVHNSIVGAKTFYKTVQGLYNLALFRQRIGIRIVVHKQTYKRLPQFADFIYHNFPFVAQVAFMQMETIGLAKENIDSLWIDPYDYNTELKEAVLLLWDRGIPAYIYNAQLCVLPEEVRQFAAQSISDWKDIYLDECEGCVLKGKCAGFFESNRKYHSKHIKPQKTYTPQPKPLSDDISPFVKICISQLDLLNNSVVYDIPCGYGRHSMWLSKMGHEVHCIDIDDNAINCLIKRNSCECDNSMAISRQDIMSIEEVAVCDLLINVHLYSPDFINIFTRLLKPQGYLIIETPDNRGGNYTELPEPGTIKSLIKDDYDIIEYYESAPVDGRVSVKVFARKKTPFV